MSTISDEELANLRSYYQAHPEYSHWAEPLLIARLDAAEAESAALLDVAEAAQEVVSEAEQEGAEIDGPLAFSDALDRLAATLGKIPQGEPE